MKIGFADFLSGLGWLTLTLPVQKKIKKLGHGVMGQIGVKNSKLHNMGLNVVFRVLLGPFLTLYSFAYKKIIN